MSSRDIATLCPEMQAKARQFLKVAELRGLDVLIYCMHRSPEEQARLYRRGRSLRRIRQKADRLAQHYERPDLAEILMNVGPQYGRRATGAGPGQSYHQYGRAFDGCPLVDGKPLWETDDPWEMALWEAYGEVGEEVGLRWAGRWHGKRREFPHMQLAGAHWHELIRAAERR